VRQGLTGLWAGLYRSIDNDVRAHINNTTADNKIMLQLHNNTPFSANMALFPDEQAVETLYLIVKATFDIGSDWTLNKEQTPPFETDEYWTEPGKSSIKFASEFHTGKPCSDIIMLGYASSPDAKETTQLDVKLSVGKVSKTVRVFGERHWKNGCISPAKPFTTMAMVYEKAFGGVHIVDGEISTLEEQNPVGHGFSGKRTASEMDGVPLPNLEAPEHLITDTKDRPQPACFGVSCPQWQPRSSFAGTYDAAWQAQRAPYLPVDYDRRFLNMAHPDLIYPGYLQGGELVEITNMHPGGPLNFTVPYIKLSAKVDVAGNTVCPEFCLETLLIEPNQLRLGMTWRAAIKCDKKSLKIGNISINMSR